MLKKTNKFFIFLIKDIHLNMNFKYSFLFQFISPLLYLTIFFFISKYISEISDTRGTDYFLFVSLGICMIDILSNIVSSQAREIVNMKASGVIEEIIFLDNNINSTLFAISAYSVFVSLVKFIVYISFISLFNGSFIIPMENMFLFFITFLALVISFISMGIIAGIYALRFHKIGFIPVGFLVVSIVFGSAYFPSEILPNYIQKISYLTSFSFGIENLRLLLDQNVNVKATLFNIVFILMLSVIYYSIGSVFLKLSVAKIKKSGSFGKF
jgi:ABC-type polysaccharide/polyol phosphate export permease